MKLLSGSELAGFVKERQAKQVRNLRQSWQVQPRLAIIQTIDSPVIDTYVRLKQAYGEDILVDVEVHKVSDADIMTTIDELNANEAIHGVIIQLPLGDTKLTEDAVNRVDPKKDVDGLAQNSAFVPATPMAIDWLLVGYGVDLRNKQIAIVGRGRLVGAPLAHLWQDQGLDVTVFDRSNADDLADVLKEYDVIVTAVGQPRLIDSASVKIGAVVVDAATSSENGKLVGDLTDEVRVRDDLTITPAKGGVGPLTVTALFDNVIAAARQTVSS